MTPENLKRTTLRRTIDEVGTTLVRALLLIVRNKEKEIGIRKVIGASEFSIFKLLVTNFSAQLITGMLLSIPITYWLMNNWLSDFTYRISLSLDLFVLGCVISLLVALFTVSFHTLKAAKISPIESIKSE